MIKKIYLEGENINFVDGVQTTPRKLDEIVKGSHSAHKTRHESGGSDKITPIAEDIEIEEIGEATYDDIQNWINNTQSSGYIEGGLIEARVPADGKVDISEVKGFLKITDSNIGVTKSFNLARTTEFVLASEGTNYIYVWYDTGTPKFAVTTTRADIKTTWMFTLGRVYKDGNDTHIIQSGVQLPNFLRESHERLLAVRRFERASGGTVTENGNRFLQSQAGVFYLGNNKSITTGVNTNNEDTFTRHYHSGGVWTSDIKSQIAEGGASFYKYDDGATLQNLSNNKYGVFWVFIHFDGDLHVVVGRGDYKLAEAQTTTVPTIPNEINDFATLAAKIILLEGEPNFFSIQTAYEVFFPLDGGFDHNDLGNIQGGAVNNYYHLSSTELEALNKQTIRFKPVDAVLPTANSPELVQINGTNHSYPVLDFDKTTDEKCDWHFTIPANWGSENITARIKYIANVTSGDVMWVMSYKGISETENIDQTLTDEVFPADTVDGTANRLCIASKAFSLTGITAGEWVILKLTRNADDGGDTLDADARLLEIVIEWNI